MSFPLSTKQRCKSFLMRIFPRAPQKILDKNSKNLRQKSRELIANVNSRKKWRNNQNKNLWTVWMVVLSNALIVQIVTKIARLLVDILQRVIQVFLRITLKNNWKEMNVPISVKLWRKLKNSAIIFIATMWMRSKRNKRFRYSGKRYAC